MPYNRQYFQHIIHMNDSHEEFPTLCGATMGDTQNTDPEKVNCNKCKRFMEDSKLLAASRKKRKEYLKEKDK